MFAVSKLSSDDAKTLIPTKNGTYYYDGRGSRLQVYCYQPFEKAMVSMWLTITTNISLSSSEYLYYIGHSEETVKEEYEKQNSYWTFINIVLPKMKLHSLLNPFKTTCVGVLAESAYYFSFEVDEFNSTLLFLFIVGIAIIIFAKQLSVNLYFHYLCGITSGIIVSLLLPLYFALMQIKKKFYFYGSLLGVWFLGFYILKLVFRSLELLFIAYLKYVLIYMALSGFGSFIICYRFGPVTNPRTEKIMEWLLVIGGIILVYNSSFLYEVTSLLIVVLFMAHVLPVPSWLFKIISVSGRYLNGRKTPPVIKRLTMDEYDQQGSLETRKHLEALRNYCSSPNVNQWRIINNLSDPSGFAKFMETGSDISLMPRHSIFTYEISSDESD